MRSIIARNSGTQEPQFVPARNARPISATFAAPAAMASRIAESPMPKQAQITGPVSAIPSPLRPESSMRRSCSAIVPVSNSERTTSHCGGACSGPTKMLPSSRPEQNAAMRVTPRD